MTGLLFGDLAQTLSVSGEPGVAFIHRYILSPNYSIAYYD